MNLDTLHLEEYVVLLCGTFTMTSHCLCVTARVLYIIKSISKCMELINSKAQYSFGEDCSQKECYLDQDIVFF